MKSVFFLLGSGASVDSGLKTYRGNDNSYYNFDEDDIEKNPLHFSALFSKGRMEKMWEHLQIIKDDIPKNPGPTYNRIREICSTYDHAMIATQNIDGLALGICDNVVELHGNIHKAYCTKCFQNYFQTCFLDVSLKTKDTIICKCGGLIRPDIVLFGENLKTENTVDVFSFIRQYKPSICYVIGTSMRFPYLRKIINKIKSIVQFPQIIHVNPDPDYNCHSHCYKSKYSSISASYRHVLVKKRKPEILIKSL